MNPRTMRCLALLMIAVLAACAKPSTPQEVAGAFWTAIEAGDTRAVKQQITAADAATLESLDDVLPISKSELGRIVIDGASASIDTKVTVDGDKPLDFPLQTHLVLEQDEWKVDYSRTIEAVADAGKLAAVIEKVHEFGNALQQGIERSVEELEHTLPAIEDQIKQHVPELRKRLEQFTQELEDAMKRPPADKPSAAGEAEGSVEI